MKSAWRFGGSSVTACFEATDFERSVRWLNRMGRAGLPLLAGYLKRLMLPPMPVVGVASGSLTHRGRRSYSKPGNALVLFSKQCDSLVRRRDSSQGDDALIGGALHQHELHLSEVYGFPPRPGGSHTPQERRTCLSRGRVIRDRAPRGRSPEARTETKR